MPASSAAASVPHPPLARGAAGRRPRLPRLDEFQRVQLMLVLWTAVTGMVTQIGVGFQVLPVAGTPPDRMLVAGAAALRFASAGSYPLFAFVVCRRLPLWHRSVPRAALYLGVLAGSHALAWLCTVANPELVLRGGDYLQRSFEFVVYALFAHGMLYGQRAGEKEREELRLQARMAGSTADAMRARMRALRMEWSPHFLTGTLEAVGSLLAADRERAKRILVALSAVLRRTLAHARTDRVPMEQEVEMVQAVLRVETLCRPDLAVTWEVEPDAREHPVPHMALLTMVCTALRGTGPGGRLRISAAQDGDALLLRVAAEGGAWAGGGTEAAPPAHAAGLEFRRIAERPGEVCLELRCTDEADAPAAAPASSRPPSSAGGRGPDVSGPPVRPADAPLPAGGSLEAGTYTLLVLFYSFLTVYMAWAQVNAGSVVPAAPAWLYLCGIGAYAALWWASLVMVARWLAARYPGRSTPWLRLLGVHALGAFTVGIANGLAYAPFQIMLVHGGAVNIGLGAEWQWGNLAVYPGIAGIAHGFAWSREYHARHASQLRLRSLLAESELARTTAELQALKAELNPHFLFNALNTVSSLMHTHPEEARRVVEHLSALLRRVLESGGLQEVTVAEEVEFIRLYMEIEQARFGDALRMVYDVDPATEGARVPHLLIQPLVENAVKHGLRPRGGTGEVRVCTRAADGRLELRVEDDGVGLAHRASAEGTGTGLANVRERLAGLYGAAHSFELMAGDGGGTVARIRIPLSENGREASPALHAAVPA